MPIVWSPDLSVNVELLDHQHQDFLKVLNELYSSLQDFQNMTDLDVIFTKLKTYIDAHFTTEEGYFHQYHYPDTAVHIEEHHKFKIKMADFAKHSHGGQMTLYLELIDYLEEWLVNHLKSMDQKYSHFFNSQGLF
ncbi:MAG: bacteriohemerythrin [Candidatus Shapirobacteria bacterium]|jgi:hemerythrin-like metal-binding protein